MTTNVAVIIVAAGAGTRMQANQNKVFLPVGSKRIIEWTMEQVVKVHNLSQVVVVTAAGEQERMQSLLADYDVPIIYVQGGATRQASVYNGLLALPNTTDVVLIHDGARPMARTDVFNTVARKTASTGAAVAAVSAKDTITRVIDGHVQETLVRSELYHMQTPQGFQYKLIKEAHEVALRDGFAGTDDVSLVERLGHSVSVVESSYQNIKVTTPNDLVQAKQYLGIQEGRMRVGFGYDIHRLVEGRTCVLGGVTIPSAVGPDGHSDADVLIHALMDAMLGAAGLKDIGYYFPPEDDQYKGISSMLLLEKVNSLLKERHLRAYNIDIMVIAEVPKLKPYIDTMKGNLSRALDIPVDRISVKATTNEMLGAIGRKEGIAAQAVVTLYESEEEFYD